MKILWGKSGNVLDLKEKIASLEAKCRIIQNLVGRGVDFTITDKAEMIKAHEDIARYKVRLEHLEETKVEEKDEQVI